LASANDVVVADKVPECLKMLQDKYGCGTTEDNKKAAKAAQVVVLAIKPQDMAGLLEELRPVIDVRKS